jgi:hypothetical protein
MHLNVTLTQQCFQKVENVGAASECLSEVVYEARGLYLAQSWRNQEDVNKGYQKLRQFAQYHYINLGKINYHQNSERA